MRQSMRAWVYSPHSGGRPISPAVRLRTEERIRSYAEARYAGKFCRLDIRFRGALCYIDAWVDETTEPLHLCRLRFFGNEEAWSLAFYTYSHERYEPTFFPNGAFQGLLRRRSMWAQCTCRSVSRTVGAGQVCSPDAPSSGRLTPPRLPRRYETLQFLVEVLHDDELRRRGLSAGHGLDHQEPLAVW
jgi:hypothetical protein